MRLLIYTTLLGLILASAPASAQQLPAQIHHPVNLVEVAPFDAQALRNDRRSLSTARTPTVTSRDTLIYAADAPFFADLPGDPNDPVRSAYKKYATRFTSTRSGTLLSILFQMNANPDLSLVGTGTLRTTISTVDQTNLVPGMPLASVDVPFTALRIGQWNSIDLEDLGLSLTAGQEFFASFEVVNGSSDARVEFLLDGGSTDSTDTDYFPARSLLFIDPPGNWSRWATNNNFLIAAVVGNPNNTAEEAIEIAYGFVSNGASINPEGDIDYYRFEAQAGEVVEIEATPGTGSELDGKIWLYDRDGDLLEDADLTFSGDPENLSYAFSEAGMYFIRYAYWLDDDDFPNKAGGKSAAASPSSQEADEPLQEASVREREKLREARSPAQGGPDQGTAQPETGSYQLSLSLGTLPPPDNFEVGDGLDGVVALDWPLPIEGSLDYGIYRSTSSSGPFTNIATAPSSNFVDTGLVNGTTYFYRVTTLLPGLGVESAQSVTVSGTPDRERFKVNLPLTSIAPTLDGNIASGEWADAVAIDITSPFLGDVLPVTMWLKNDEQFLYLALDDPNGTTPEFNLIGIYFDSDNNNTWDPSSPSTEGNFWIDDFQTPVQIRFRGRSGDYPFTSSDAIIDDPVGVDAAVSSASGHIVYEVAIDLTQNPLQALPGSTIGLWVFSLTEGFTGEWPGGAFFTAPITFADVTLGSSNRCPVVVNPIEDQTLFEGGAPFERDLTTVFTDPEGDPLTFLIFTNQSSVAGVGLTGSSLLVIPGSAGSATITVSADDEFCGVAVDAFNVTVLPNQPPSLSHIPVTSATAGQPLTLSATITDDNGIATAVIRYFEGGSDTPIFVVMTETSSNRFEGTIPASAVNARGLAYAITALDVSDVVSGTGLFFVTVSVGGEGLSQSVRASGVTENAYRLISVPLDLTNESSRAVLEDDLGTYNPTEWRFFGLNANQTYDEFPTGTASSMPPGRAFWLAASSAGQQWDTGPGTSVTISQAFRVTLNAGWNFIATPFNFNVARSFLEMESGQALDTRFYGGSWTNYSGPLRPFEGYALSANATDRLLIYPNFKPKAAAKGQGRKPATSEPALANDTPSFAWSIRILAQARQARDEDNVAAVADGAARAWDALDRPEPPIIGDYVSVYFPHPEWQTPFFGYSTDVRPLPQASESWTFEVQTNIPDQVTLRFEGIDAVPPDFEVWLVDELSDAWQDLREHNTYIVAGDGEQHPRAFRLLVGRSDALAQEATREIPESFVLENFPNPFNPQTTIRFGLPTQERVTLAIYNMLGEKIATLVDHALKAAGYHTVVWDGRNQAGHPVASGLYFYTLQSEHHRTSRRMVLVK